MSLYQEFWKTFPSGDRYIQLFYKGLAAQYDGNNDMKVENTNNTSEVYNVSSSLLNDLWDRFHEESIRRAGVYGGDTYYHVKSEIKRIIEYPHEVEDIIAECFVRFKKGPYGGL